MDERLPLPLQRTIARVMRRGALRVCGIGNALLDIVVQPHADDVLPQSLEWGAARHLDSRTLDGLRQEFPGGRLHAGGGAANTLAALAVFGAGCRLIGAVGQDSAGDTYRADLEHQGVSCALQTVPGTTGRCLVLLPPRQGGAAGAAAETASAGPAIAAAPAAAAKLDPHYVKHQLAQRAAAPAPDVLFIEGFLLPRSAVIETALAAVRTAGAMAAGYLPETGATLIALSLGSAGLAAEYRETLRQKLLPAVDLLFSNEAEFRALFDLPSRLPLMASQQNLPAGRVPPTVVTRGRGGATLLWDGGAIHSEGVTLDESAATATLDSVGAGDVFAGAFIAALFAGLRIEAALRFANRAAASSLLAGGGRIPSEQRERLREELRGVCW
ncbi:MAG: hypothetical protein EA404_15630 [Spirochaetaceae bacterium]|nr:MAG: hypothetical protein EA404_15630 [Spirochaetaceae bacterium]